MNVVVIDGQGGQLGAQLVKEISLQLPNINIIAIGTNAMATASMLKAGAKKGATGENPTVVACRNADVIMGPVGIVIADSLLGEVTEKMAVAVGRADAVRILIPMNPFLTIGKKFKRLLTALNCTIPLWRVERASFRHF